MDPLTIGFIMVGLLVVLILLGIHIGLALMGTALLGLWWVSGSGTLSSAGHLLGSGVYSSLFSFILAVVPFFAIMGLLVNLSGAGNDLYDTAARWLNRVPGNLAVATVGANAVFAAVTGVSVASAAVFSKVALPHMKARGYDNKLSLGCIAGSSVLGMLIPPSTLLIVYGLFSMGSIGKLFIGGIVPGIVLSILYSIIIIVMVKLKPSLAGSKEVITVSWNERFKSLGNTWGVLALVGLALGGIYIGWFTALEAGAIGAFGAFGLVAVKRKLSLTGLWRTLIETGLLSASFFFLFIGAQMFSRMLCLTGVAAFLSETAGAMPLPPAGIIMMFVLVYLVLGMFLDCVSELVITLPLMLPVVSALGYDLIWFGVVAVVSAEMGIITPPFGMIIFVIKAAIGEEGTIEEMFIGAFPFLLMIMVLLGLLIAFPMLVTWLPNQL